MLKEFLEDFISHVKKDQNIELYNEAGLQHELALFLRGRLDSNFRVQLERNINDVANFSENLEKKEMDIYIKNITNPDEKYCIELKVSYGSSIASRIIKIHEDVFFLEQLKRKGFRECYLLFATPSNKYIETKPDRLKMYDTFSKKGIKIEHLHKDDVSPSYKKLAKDDYIFKYDDQYIKNYAAEWQELKTQENRNSRQNGEQKWKCILLEI